MRRPPLASRTASAVPKEPAPMTVARRGPGVGKVRVRAIDVGAGLGVGWCSVIR